MQYKQGPLKNGKRKINMGINKQRKNSRAMKGEINKLYSIPKQEKVPKKNKIKGNVKVYIASNNEMFFIE